MEEESSVEAEKTAEPGPVTRQPHVMACYQSYLAQYQVMSAWIVSMENLTVISLCFIFTGFLFKMIFYQMSDQMNQMLYLSEEWLSLSPPNS